MTPPTLSASELFSHVGRDDLAALDDLIAAADQLSRRGRCQGGPLIDWLEPQLHPGGVWGDRRLIIFTEYRATQNWLHNRLSGGAGTKTATASTGGHGSATRRGGKGS